MLKFRLVTLIFISAIAVSALYLANPLVWIILLIIYIAVIVYGSVNIESELYGKVLCRGTENNQITLTFDDGPDPVNTPLILDILKENRYKATFFCIGEKLEKYPEIAARIHREGHILGNHSYFHTSWFPLKSVTSIRKELEETRKIIQSITKERNIYFKPPFGVMNPLISNALIGMGFVITGWSIRSFDLSNRTSDQIVGRLHTKLTKKGGHIILLHDTSPKATMILQSLLKLINDKEIVRLDKLKVENFK